MCERLLPRRIDDQRLRSALDGNVRRMHRGWFRPLQEREHLDDLAVRFGNPDFARRVDPTDVVGAATQLDRCNDCLRGRVHDIELPARAVDGEEQTSPLVGGRRALPVPALEATFRAIEPPPWRSLAW